MIQIKTFKTMGRGLITTKPIKKGRTFYHAEVIELNKKDTKLVEKTALKHYNYALGHGRTAIVLGLGSLFNHSNNDNVEYVVVKRKGRYMVKYTALRDIKKGEQLFIDYGYNPHG